MKELDAMLEIKNLSKVLEDRPILKNISLTLEPGEILAVIGPNGAGKSTFFRCTVGLLKPTSGEIIFDGKVVKKDSTLYKKKLGFLGHDSFLYNNMTPVENLKYYGKLYKVKDLDQKINALLRKVGLTLFKDTPTRSFSRGMIQRLAIARVLLAEPKILMLDEPHTGLDQAAVSLLNKIILEKKRAGISILLISHDFEHVHALADRAAILIKGKIADIVKLDRTTDINTLKDWYEKVASG